MSAFKLIWSDRALSDLDNGFEQLAEKSTKLANNTIGSILTKADQLLEFPESGPKEPKLAHLKVEYRYLVQGHHKIIYRIDSLQIFIVRVFDTRKDPAKMKP